MIKVSVLQKLMVLFLGFSLLTACSKDENQKMIEYE